MDDRTLAFLTAPSPLVDPEVTIDPFAGAAVEGDALAPDAYVYGGGEAFQGPNLRGRLRHNVNVETHGASGLDRSYLTVPFFWSDAGWGVLCHTGAPMLADLGATHGEAATFSVDGDELDLFVFTGSPVEIMQGDHAVTGLPGRFPEWALGVWTSRCSYFTAAEV